MWITNVFSLFLFQTHSDWGVDAQLNVSIPIPHYTTLQCWFLFFSYIFGDFLDTPDWWHIQIIIWIKTNAFGLIHMLYSKCSKIIFLLYNSTSPKKWSMLAISWLPLDGSLNVLFLQQTGVEWLWARWGEVSLQLRPDQSTLNWAKNRLVQGCHTWTTWILLPHPLSTKANEKSWAWRGQVWVGFHKTEPKLTHRDHTCGHTWFLYFIFHLVHLGTN